MTDTLLALHHSVMEIILKAQPFHCDTLLSVHNIVTHYFAIYSQRSDTFPNQITIIRSLFPLNKLY